MSRHLEPLYGFVYFYYYFILFVSVICDVQGAEAERAEYNVDKISFAIFIQFFIYRDYIIIIKKPRRGKGTEFPISKSKGRKFILKLQKWAKPSSSARRAKVKMRFFSKFRPWESARGKGLSENNSNKEKKCIRVPIERRLENFMFFTKTPRWVTSAQAQRAEREPG